MSEPITRVYNSATFVSGVQQAVSLDYLAMDSAIIAVSIDGAATYSVEFTLDDVNNPDVTPIWFTMNEFPVGTAITHYATIYYPFRFIRLNIEGLAGTLYLKVAQGTTPSM